MSEALSPACGGVSTASPRVRALEAAYRTYAVFGGANKLRTTKPAFAPNPNILNGLTHIALGVRVSGDYYLPSDLFAMVRRG